MIKTVSLYPAYLTDDLKTCSARIQKAHTAVQVRNCGNTTTRIHPKQHRRLGRCALVSGGNMVQDTTAINPHMCGGEKKKMTRFFFSDAKTHLHSSTSVSLSPQQCTDKQPRCCASLRYAGINRTHPNSPVSRVIVPKQTSEGKRVF